MHIVRYPYSTSCCHKCQFNWNERTDVITVAFALSHDIELKKMANIVNVALEMPAPSYHFQEHK